MYSYASVSNLGDTSNLAPSFSIISTAYASDYGAVYKKVDTLNNALDLYNTTVSAALDWYAGNREQAVKRVLPVYGSIAIGAAVGVALLPLEATATGFIVAVVAGGFVAYKAQQYINNSLNLPPPRTGPQRRWY